MCIISIHYRSNVWGQYLGFRVGYIYVYIYIYIYIYEYEINISVEQGCIKRRLE